LTPLKSHEIDRLQALLSALVPVQSQLSLPLLLALMTLAAEPGLSVNELAERLRAPQQTASRYASILLGRYPNPVAGPPLSPLLSQEINAGDPRKRALFLTNAGFEIVTSLLRASRKR
jgi:DNA-binding MarR family transcriptional regulator